MSCQSQSSDEKVGRTEVTRHFVGRGLGRGEVHQYAGTWRGVERLTVDTSRGKGRTRFTPNLFDSLDGFRCIESSRVQVEGPEKHRVIGTGQGPDR